MTDLIPIYAPGALAAARQAQQDALLGDDQWQKADTLCGVWLSDQKFADGTREQYSAVYDAWREWCIATGITPFEAKRSDVIAYTSALAKFGNPAARRPRPLAKRTIARHMASLSSFYACAIEEEVAERNPVPVHGRPKALRKTRQPHLTRDQNRALLAAADRDGVRAAALVALLLLSCLRISEALGARIEDLTHEQGYDWLWTTRKGNKGLKTFLAPEAAARIRAAAGDRREGPIVATRTGRPLDRKAAWELIRRLGREAGISVPIGPHTLRHAYITRGHELQVPLADLQDAAGHSNPKTTRGYDRSGDDPERQASLKIARDLAGPDEHGNPA